jgi:hypothetical protein
MLVVFVAPVPRGRPEESRSLRAQWKRRDSQLLKTLDTGQAAIDWGKAGGHIVQVARVQNADKNSPDHWRRPRLSAYPPTGASCELPVSVNGAALPRPP